MLPRVTVLLLSACLAFPARAGMPGACAQDVGTYLAVQERNKSAARNVLAAYGEVAVPLRARRLLQRLLAHLDSPGPLWSLHGYRSTALNAMSGLDGTLLLSSSMWSSHSPLTDAELAAALAHELAHVLRGHAVQTDCMKAGPHEDALALELSLGMLSHQQELEADRDAAVLLRRAGLPVEGLRSLLRRLARDGNSGTNSHPAAGDRLRALSALP